MKSSLHDLLLNGAAEIGVELSERQIDSLLLLMLQLKKWNRKFNLTAITKERDIVVKHFLDSLTVSQRIAAGCRVLDLGSGAGFPALPLALVRPDLIVTSVDAVEKKIFFQRHGARLLELERFTTLHARGEALAVSHTGRFDVVISRAFSSLLKLVTLAQPLLAPGGVIIAMKGKSGGDEAKEATPFLEERGVLLREVVRLRLPVSADERTLVILGEGRSEKAIA